MSLNQQDQKLIYDFLTSALETMEGFQKCDNLEFVYNPNLESDALASFGITPQAKPQSPRDASIRQAPTARPSTRPEPTRTFNASPKAAPPKQEPKAPTPSSVPMPPAPEGITEAFTEYFTLEELRALSNAQYEVSQCTSCKLAPTRKTTVFGEGCFVLNNDQGLSLRPTVMVIGEAPGAEEDITSRPFVGRAGQLLDKMLAPIGLFRNQNCYICNVVKCRPPNNRQPEADEVAACIPYLYQQIKLIRPKFILLLGRTASHALLDTSYGINAIHGKWFEVLNIPTMCTYHPSALLHDESLKRPTWEDLKLFKQHLDESAKE